jgi:hypothetical protein
MGGRAWRRLPFSRPGDNGSLVFTIKFGVRGKDFVNFAATTLVTLATASLAFAQTQAQPVAQPPATPPGVNVRHVIGLDNIKLNDTGTLIVADGGLHFKTSKAENTVPIASIDDIFIGTEATQSGGKTGRVVKTVAIAAPYESGKVLTILMRTKVDILTVSFHDPDGALHGAIFALPIGQAEQMRSQLVQAGAHASSEDSPVSERSKP